MLASLVDALKQFSGDGGLGNKETLEVQAYIA